MVISPSFGCAAPSLEARGAPTATLPPTIVTAKVTSCPERRSKPGSLSPAAEAIDSALKP
jgi:hypothetical protein